MLRDHLVTLVACDSIVLYMHLQRYNIPVPHYVICIKYYCDNNEMKSCYNYNGFIPGCFAILVVGTMQTFPQVTSNVNPGRRGVLSGASIPMITELGQFMNISSFSG